MEPTLKKLHEKAGTWNHTRLLEFIDGKVAIGNKLLREFIEKSRGPAVPLYLAPDDED